MPSFYPQCRFFSLVCLAMLAFGVTLPSLLVYSGSDVVLSPFVYNVFQIGGLSGVVVFGLARRFSNPARRQAAVQPLVAGVQPNG